MDETEQAGGTTSGDDGAARADRARRNGAWTNSGAWSNAGAALEPAPEPITPTWRTAAHSPVDRAWAPTPQPSRYADLLRPVDPPSEYVSSPPGESGGYLFPPAEPPASAPPYPYEGDLEDARKVAVPSERTAPAAERAPTVNGRSGLAAPGHAGSGGAAPLSELVPGRDRPASGAGVSEEDARAFAADPLSPDTRLPPAAGFPPVPRTIPVPAARPTPDEPSVPEDRPTSLDDRADPSRDDAPGGGAPNGVPPAGGLATAASSAGGSSAGGSSIGGSSIGGVGIGGVGIDPPSRASQPIMNGHQATGGAGMPRGGDSIDLAGRPAVNGASTMTNSYGAPARVGPVSALARPDEPGSGFEGYGARHEPVSWREASGAGYRSPEPAYDPLSGPVPSESSWLNPAHSFDQPGPSGDEASPFGGPGRRSADPLFGDADTADPAAGGSSSQPDAAEALPQRVPAAPDVPTVPEPPTVEPAEAPQLARIATHLRRGDVPGPHRRPEGFDVNAVLDAVRGVAGVRDASLRTTPAGAHSLRLELADGVDPGQVSREVARLLQDRMGLAAAPQDDPVPVRDLAPAGPGPDVAAWPETTARPEPYARPDVAAWPETTARPDEPASTYPRSVETGANPRSTVYSAAVPAYPTPASYESEAASAWAPRGEPESGEAEVRHGRRRAAPRTRGHEPSSPSGDYPARDYSARDYPVRDYPAATGGLTAAGQLEPQIPMPRPLRRDGEPGPRVVIDQVQVSTFGLDATVDVRLAAGERRAAGTANGPAVDGYVLRLCAVAAATAIDQMLGTAPRPEDRGRCFVEHAAVVPFGSCEVAVVVVLLVCSGWVEQLAGSALVAGDPRHAVVRATLAAVNRRLEALL